MKIEKRLEKKERNSQGKREEISRRIREEKGQGKRKNMGKRGKRKKRGEKGVIWNRDKT
jgi:hypothetical protein